MSDDAMGRFRSSLALLTAGLIGGSCAPRAVEVPMAPQCGILAALAPRASEEESARPAACALPVAEQIAQTCAAYDWVRSPNYRPPADDDEAAPVGRTQPPPEYVVSDVECSFSDARRNRADCRFKLKTPSMQAGPVSTVATFEHEFWQDHGPTHHIYGTRWSPTATCLPQ